MKNFTAKESSQESFINLYEPLHRDLSNYCRAIERGSEDAKDLVSETLAIAYENFKNLKNRKAFKYYLFGIASRLYRKKLRRKKYIVNYNEELASAIQDNSTAAEVKLDVDFLYNAIKHLPALQKEAIILFEILGFSIKEIKEIQGGTLSAIKSRISRARQKIREMFKETA